MIIHAYDLPHILHSAFSSAHRASAVGRILRGQRTWRSSFLRATYELQRSPGIATEGGITLRSAAGQCASDLSLGVALCSGALRSGLHAFSSDAAHGTVAGKQRGCVQS